MPRKTAYIAISLLVWGVGGLIVDNAFTQASFHSSSYGSILILIPWTILITFFGILLWRIIYKSQHSKDPVPETIILNIDINKNYDFWEKSFDIFFISRNIFSAESVIW